MVSYKIFAMVVVACKRQEQRETIVGEQRDMAIGKAADAVVESEYVGGKLKTKTPSVSSLKSRERTLRTKCKASERLCAKSKNFKLISCIDGSSYLEGTTSSEKELKSVRSRYCIFECIGGYEGMTGRRKNNAKAFTSPLSTLNINQAARLLNQNCKAYYSFILEI